MKINIPKIIRELNLSEYAPEYGDACIKIWVNPPRGKMAKFETIRAELLEAYDHAIKSTEASPDQMQEIGEQIEAANNKLYEWLAENWSQSEDPEDHWTVDEIIEMQKSSNDNDPELWRFIMRRSFELILEYREGRKKKSTASS